LSCVVKLYDKNISAFKLNEQITFIGVLEFKAPEPENAEMQEQAVKEDGFFNGIPNEDRVPHLHAITSRKMAVL